MNDPTNTRDFIIDSHINLSEIARAAKKHRLTMVETLAAKGCERRDAEAFADFTYHEDTGALSDEQWDRLTLMNVEEAEANARLIASAPALLTALQTLVNSLCPYDTDPECWANAMAAIAKATGGAE